MKIAEFKNAAEALGRFKSDRLFIQAGPRGMKVASGGQSGTVVARLETMTSPESAKFFVDSTLFLQAAKVLRGKGEVTLSVEDDKDWTYLVLNTDNGGKVRFPEVAGDIDDLIRPDKTAVEWVAFEAGDMSRLSTMFGYVSENVYPYNYAELGLYNSRFARLSASNYTTQATLFLKDPQFPLETSVGIPAMSALKPLDGDGVIRVGKTGVVFESGMFSVYANFTERTFYKPLLFPNQKEGAIKVEYERKQLMDALKGVRMSDPKEGKVWLTATAEGRNFIGAWDKRNWLGINTVSHTGWSSPKAVSADYALKILARLEGKNVSLSWDHTNDAKDMTTGKPLPGWSPIFFSTKELRKWRILLAPVAQT